MTQTQLRAAPVGAPDPFYARLRKYDNMLLPVLKELRRTIRNFQDHFERDSLNYRN